MTGQAVTKPVAGLPAHLQQHVTAEAFDEFAGGVTSGFPVISYRGRTWRIRKGGEEQVYLNEQQEAIQSIECVMLKSNPVPSKVHYHDKYTEGDQSPPRCWSANGVTPDDGVSNPISPGCAACPKNVWGSKITDEGKKSRACSDVRRVAITFMHQLEECIAGTRTKDDIDVLLLRIPPATLNPLKDYAEKVLKPKGVPPYVLITRIGFDTEVSFPKLSFKAFRFLSEAEIEVAMELRNGEDTRRILNEALENVPVPEETFDGAGSTTSPVDVSGAPAQAPAEAKTQAPAPSPKLQPVEEELFSVPVEDIAPVPTRAAEVEADAENVIEAAPDVIAPPPAAAAVPAPEPAPAVPAVEEGHVPPAAAAPSDGDFEAMLKSILD
ncbi:hypothetical protein LCGC14_1215930 [marine sediment metagenome]|uniref:Uncharacterized protein n=1 Tax=marine sediment metagenome TaxID=412755 RepID=A0A0F9LCW8_9ZZZZ